MYVYLFKFKHYISINLIFSYSNYSNWNPYFNY